MSAWPSIQHGWVATVIQETKTYLERMKNHGIQSIDIEGKYFAQFLSTCQDCKNEMILFVSDNPFGGTTLDQFNVVGDLINRKFMEIAPLVIDF
jgi:microcystin degradation protein MlrC